MYGVCVCVCERERERARERGRVVVCTRKLQQCKSNSHFHNGTSNWGTPAPVQSHFFFLLSLFHTHTHTHTNTHTHTHRYMKAHTYISPQKQIWTVHLHSLTVHCSVAHTHQQFQYSYIRPPVCIPRFANNSTLNLHESILGQNMWRKLVKNW